MLNLSCSLLDVEIDPARGHLDVSPDGRAVLRCCVSRGELSAVADAGAVLYAEVTGAELSASIDEGARLYASVVCELGARPYLEIDPTYLWLLPEDEASNDVLSNTFWNIN